MNHRDIQTSHPIMKTAILKFGLIWSFTVPGLASAAQFLNLDFEQPITPLVPNDPLGFDRVPIIQAMPAWSAFLGDTPTALVLHNNIGLSSANIALLGPGFGINAGRIEGSYTAFLQSGRDIYFSAGADTLSASLAQVGDVPFDTRSVRLKVQSVGPFSVYLDGQQMPMIPLSTGPNFTLYATDATAFAGQTAELRITSDLFFSAEIGGYSYMWFDSIIFSPELVPEPSTWGLLGMGGLLMAVSRMRKSRRA